MKYYSEVTSQLYDSAEDLADAESKVAEEKAAKEKAEAIRSEKRKKDAEEIEIARTEYKEAYKLYLDAYQNYQNLMKKFLENYGQYHATFRSDNWEDLTKYLFSNLF